MIRQRKSKTAVACATLGAAIVCALAFSVGPAAAAPKPKPECSDHIDNDGDGVVDYRKRGGDDDCTSREDTSERLTLECSDLDGDGYAWDPPTLPHATASCIPGPGGTGVAYIDSCDRDYSDLDGNPLNGCEYGPVPYRGPEECNGLDDDVDGSIDEGLTLPPSGPNSTIACHNGTIVAFCHPGFIDANGDPLDGCEATDETTG